LVSCGSHYAARWCDLIRALTANVPAEDARFKNHSGKPLEEPILGLSREMIPVTYGANKKNLSEFENFGWLADQ
jgi:hypothetical protein